MSYLIQARLRADTAGSDGALIKLMSETGAAPGKLHDLVWTLFGDTGARTRDFVFRVDHEAGRPSVMAYAPRRPHADAERLWRVEAKPFQPRLFPGDRLRFKLRVNPVKQHGGTRIDAVYDTFDKERTAAKAAGQQPPDRLEVARRVGTDWLDRRAERLGLHLAADTVQAESYATERLVTGRGRPPFTLSILDLTGEAEVVDPQAVATSLPAGIGKGRAYGCGMMLLARAPTGGAAA